MADIHFFCVVSHVIVKEHLKRLAVFRACQEDLKLFTSTVAQI